MNIAVMGRSRIVSGSVLAGYTALGALLAALIMATAALAVGQPPSVEGESSSHVAASEAKLEAQINPNGQATTYAFEYATNAQLTGATVVPGAGPLPAEFAGRSVSVTAEGLRQRTIYYYRVVASSAAGTEQGSVQAFRTLGAPVATTGPAQQVSRTAASVSAIVNPEGTPASVHIEYIDEASYEAAVAAGAENPYAGGGGHVTPEVALAGSETKAYDTGPIELRELRAGTTYHFAAVASNAWGTGIGQDVAFTTSPAMPPIVTTGEAVGVTQTAATLTGTVDTRGLPTTMSFEVGETPRLGAPEPASVVAGSESGTTVGTALVFGDFLPPTTTFYYRAMAANADGASYGVVKTFTTSSFPAPPTFGVPAPLSPQSATEPPASRPGVSHKRKSGSARRLAQALRACAKAPKHKRAACRRRARRRLFSRS